jgi:hypothetical protein
VKELTLIPLRIFPWFHVAGSRFRESLKTDDRQGPTIQRVIEAVNYFLCRNFIVEEVEFLSSYYRNMEIPIPSKCLSTIVVVYRDFLLFQSHPESPLAPNSGMPLAKKSQGQIMSSHEWGIAVVYAIDTLQQNRRCRITIAAFTIDSKQNRFIVKESALPYLKIFPWFYSTGSRYRQTLKKEESQGTTIEQVLEAANYFLGRDGSDYSREELDFLSSYFQTMAIPTSALCLSTVVEVYREFISFFNSNSVVAMELGNRGSWFPIREEDRPTRHQWCVPGGVFGMFPDGIGPLVPFQIRTPHSLVVFSFLSEDPGNPPGPRQHYVCVVLVSPPPSCPAH